MHFGVATVFRRPPPKRLAPQSTLWGQRWGTILLCSWLLNGCASVSPVSTQALPDAAQAASAQRFSRLQGLDTFALEAKLAVQYGGKGYTARLQWQHAAQADHLQIYSPLGQQVALIERTLDGVTLTDQRGRVHQADDVASLTESLLGWRLPLTGLSQWILAAPHSGSPYQVDYQQGDNPQLNVNQTSTAQPADKRHDADPVSSQATPLPASLHQDDWHISYDDYRPTPFAHGVEQLPYSTRLQQEDIRLKLVIQHW